MEKALVFIRLYFKVISFVAPHYAAKKAFKMFQKVRKKDVRAREQSFFDKARNFKVQNQSEDIFGYELGNPDGKEVFLVHGWDSNVGSMSKIAFQLSEAGYRVLAMNLPGHGDAQRSSTNLFEAKECFKKFLNHIDPNDGFHCISHSFGSAVVSYAMSELNRQADQLVFLTSPNKIQVIFEEFKEAVQLGDRAYNIFCDMASEIVGEDVHELTVSNKLGKAKYNSLSIIHDKNDKVILIKNSKEIKIDHPETKLEIFSNIGHYRMLWNDEVIKKVKELVAENAIVSEYL